MRQIRHSEIDMTQGSVVAQLIAFSIPLLLGEVFQQLYNTADTLIVGRFVSKQALAAVSATSNIVNILIGLFAGISTGATVDISNRFGAQDDTGLKRSVQTTLWFTAALGVAFTAVGIVFTPLMLRLLGTPEDVFLSARLYLTVYFAGVLGLVFYNMCSHHLRHGKHSARSGFRAGRSVWCPWRRSCHNSIPVHLRVHFAAHDVEYRATRHA